MALRIADRTWAGFVSELVHLAADHPDCEDRLDVLFTDSPPTSFAENSAALSGITNLLKEVWEGPLDDAAAFKLISEFILVRIFCFFCVPRAYTWLPSRLSGRRHSTTSRPTPHPRSCGLSRYIVRRCVS